MAELSAAGYFAAWADRHRESEAARKAAWKAAHPEAVREAHRRYRAKQRRQFPDPESLISRPGVLISSKHLLSEDLEQERALARLTHRPQSVTSYLRTELGWLAHTRPLLEPAGGA